MARRELERWLPWVYDVGFAVNSTQDDHRELKSRLHVLAQSLHHDPDRLRHDEELLERLIGLYQLDDSEIWDKAVAPFLAAHSRALRRAYEEHAILNEDQEFDLFELPLIFERLENDRLALRRAWPNRSEDLGLLADIWGVPVGV